MEDKQLIACAIEMNDLLMKHKKVEHQLSCIGMYKKNNDFSLHNKHLSNKNTCI